MARPTEEGSTSVVRTSARQRAANARASRASARRFQTLSEWNPDNTQAAETLASGGFQGTGVTGPPSEKIPGSGFVVPEFTGTGYSGLTADQYRSQAESAPNPIGGQHAGLPDPAAAERAAERKRQLQIEANRAGRKQALEQPGGRPDTDRMTWKEYNALSPEQRAAVDFNTMLVRAVRTDLKNTDDYAASSDDQMTYDATLEKMFGSSDRGSEIYAPETLGLLQQIKYHDTSADLDDFLKLKAAITTEDLADLPTVEGVPQAVAYSGQAPERTEELGLKRGLANSTAEMEATLAKGNEMLQSIQAVALKDREWIVDKLGGPEQQQITAALGYQPPNRNPETGEPLDLNTFFQDGFNNLANRANTKDQDSILAAIKAPLSDSEYTAFLNYANSRSNNAQRFQLPLGEGKGVEYRSPQDFRDLLGLKGGTPSGPTY